MSNASANSKPHVHGDVQGRKAGVVIASTRAAAGLYRDETGPVIIDWLTEHGFEPFPAMVVPDGEPVGAAIRRHHQRRHRAEPR